jgi:hypothetical protein
MKLRTFIAAVGAAAVVGSGAFALPALASPHSTTHTLTFISETKTTVSLTKTSVAIQDTDVNKAGKIIGFDEVYGVATSATSSAANVTVDTSGGMLYGTFTINLKTGEISNGKVAGGTGAFKNAAGTFTAKDINSTDTAITITYTT